METIQTRFASFLQTAFDRGDYATDDVIAFVRPLFRKVLRIHEEGKVAPFEKEESLFVAGLCVDIDMDLALPPTDALSKVQSLFPRRQPDFDIHADPPATFPDQPVHPPSAAAWLTGYQCFEQQLGHHDPQTDIFCLGLILGSMALSLDLYDPGDRQQFAQARNNPSLHRPSIHPTLSGLITEMTEPDRSRRTQDLYDVIRRLDHYREFDPRRQLDLSTVPGWIDKGPKERTALILNRLRNRLFDTSRRNRLLFYKPNKRLVNLTVGSVPMVLHYQSIRPELLFNWNEELAEKITRMQEIVLNKYLRFEDHPYLPSSLDKVRLESQRAIQEYGFSQLRLVIAFLAWNNWKEDPKERIQSPLLLLPVSLKKNKRLKEDHYILKPLDNIAEVNPVLANQLKEFYGIRLPDGIDLDEMTPEQFAKQVKTQIDIANQGISLHYIGKPRLRLIHTEARQTVNKYGKRSVPYRPDPGKYIPVELQVFRREKEARALFLQSLPQIRQASAANEAPLYEMMTSENNPYSWDFDTCNMVLGNFNYKKMSLVRDYNTVIDQQLGHHVFDALFSNQPKTLVEHPFDGNHPDDWFHVITADPSQTRAILQSRAGYSYIIQGPPGTGKSQTITNLIADFVARGKSILFVCEKRAALDVVYHRLKQVGLEELCCYIHDSQGDKREFIKNLAGTYESFLRPDKDLGAIKAARLALLEKMNGALQTLRAFHGAGLSEIKEAGITVRQLIEKIIALRQHLVPLTPSVEETLPSYKEWEDARTPVANLDAVLNDTGADLTFAAHPFSRINEAVFLSDNPHRVLDEALQQALRLLEEIMAALPYSKVPSERTDDFERLKSLVQFAVLLYPFVRAGQRLLADPDNEQTKVFEREMLHYRQQQAAHRLASEKNAHWNKKLDEQDLETALVIAEKNEGSFRGLLNGTWKRLKRQLREDYDFSAHAVQPHYTGILQLLLAEYAADSMVRQTRQQLQEKYGLDNIDTAWLTIELLHGKKDHPELEFLVSDPQGEAMVTALEKLHQPLSRLDTLLRRCLHHPASGPLASILDLLHNIRLNAGSLGEFLPALRSLAALPDRVKSALRDLPLQSIRIEAATARKTLNEYYQANRAFAHIDEKALEAAVRQLGEGYTALLQLNADYIRAVVRQRFLNHVDLANRAASQLNEEQKKFKKAYNEGRKIVENEFGKTMRYKSIRELSAKESGLVLKDVKPVWLMSPYSVSDSLPLDFDHFDVVIFDEASQITLEEGVPALYRSPQTIVVGDERQMPPTDFFSAGAKDEDPDDWQHPDGEDDDEWLSDDADSLLAQGARKLNSVLLSWHYRSHYETLISFSNHAFYEGALLTIPDKSIHHQEKAPVKVAAPEEAALQADALFDRSISFHFQTAGLYDKRSNLPEAGYIARLIKELFRRNTKESIGIVAFSQEQQHAIEASLDELAAEDVVFAQQLEEAYNRTENDQFTGLIVKNLENIQGDERDIIIMSVCYGFDSKKKMLMNFGPVNKRGGEKRLNVLFSRARRHMAVVSSIRFDNITNEYNEGANYLRRFLHYAEMISLGRMKTARSILDGLAPHKEGAGRELTPTIVRKEIRQQIEALGYEVAEQVGQSDFKCSLAVKACPSLAAQSHPDEGDYRLGILIDDSEHYRNPNLIEQYYQRPAILRAFGWKILPVFARDWLHQPQKVMEQIVRALSASTEPPPGTIAEPKAVLPLTSTDNPAAPGTTSPYDHLSFQRLVFQEAAGDKFWEAATDGSKLIVRWGRIGTRGQIQLKTFSDEEAAIMEKAKGIAEKVKGGYREV